MHRFEKLRFLNCVCETKWASVGPGPKLAEQRSLYLPDWLSVKAHPYACVINVSGPVCGAQRLNVSCDHLQQRARLVGKTVCFHFDEAITASRTCGKFPNEGGGVHWVRTSDRWFIQGSKQSTQTCGFNPTCKWLYILQYCMIQDIILVWSTEHFWKSLCRR